MFPKLLVVSLLFAQRQLAEEIYIPSDCAYDSGEGAAFDLSVLELRSGGQLPYYSVKDARYNDYYAESAGNFTYHFNICGNTLKYPDNSCKGPKVYCGQVSDDKTCPEDQRKDINNRTFAYQTKLTDTGKVCYALANTKDRHMQMKLMDASDPARGVTVVYNDGEWCGGDIGRNRKFNIEFQCEDIEYNVPDNEYVYEYESCVYNITIESIFGCPTQCTVLGNTLCSDRGICGYDITDNEAHCYCYWGFSAFDCAMADIDVEEYKSQASHPDTSQPYVHEAAVPSTVQVGGETTAITVTYDYEPFYLLTGAFQMTDTKGEYDYYWNFVHNVDPSLLPDSCINATGPCESKNPNECTDMPIANKTGTAFQVSKDGTECNLLGTLNSNHTHYRYHKNDAARGMTVTYARGGFCEGGEGKHVNRKFRIIFQCPTANRGSYLASDVLDIVSYVRETDLHSCEYEVDVRHALACPWQCLTEADRGQQENEETVPMEVCRTHGVCVADPYAKHARCICDNGWAGDDCSEKYKATGEDDTNDSHIGFQIAIGVITVIVVILIGVSIFLYLRNRTLEKYRGQLLEDDPDDVINPAFREPHVPDDLVSYSSNSNDSQDELAEARQEQAPAKFTSSPVELELPNMNRNSQFDDDEDITPPPPKDDAKIKVNISLGKSKKGYARVGSDRPNVVMVHDNESDYSDEENTGLVQ